MQVEIKTVISYIDYRVMRNIIYMPLAVFMLFVSCCSGKGADMSKETLKKKLSPEQYRVTQECGTEPPFKNAYWDNHAEGIYVDVVSGEPLFSSKDKFESGTGWPSFVKPLVSGNVIEKKDVSHNRVRTEVKSRDAGSHLGHLFSDGPAPTGLRYCINSASLRFISKDDLEKEGYGEWRKLFEPAKATTLETAVFAGGCFWGVEELFKGIKGVKETRVGYTGGATEDPDYEAVCTGKTGHAEALEIKFDPAVVTYDSLLDFFFRMHDPTILNRQHNDRGTQYRSAIFYHTQAQKEKAVAMIDRFNRESVLKKKAVTQVEAAKTFYPAEAYHQDYLLKNPGGYFCHVVRDKL